MESIILKHNISSAAAAELYAWRDALLVAKAAELKDAADAIDAAKAETATVQAAYDLYVKNAQTALTATATAIQDTKLDDAATVQAIALIVTDLQTLEVEKRKAELLAQQDRIAAELATLSTP